MKAKKLFVGGLAGLLLASASAANATILTVFDGITDGVADFDSTVTGAGGTVGVDVWDTAFSAHQSTEVTTLSLKMMVVPDPLQVTVP